jgi:plastocyanin
MVIRRLVSEWAARLVLILIIAGLFAVIMLGRRPVKALEIRGVMPEKGGWLPDELSAEVGVPLNLRLTSDDVVHGFAVGQQPWPAVDVLPGQVTELTLTFDEPGTYNYYCTRWCGPNHWRMRGTIEVANGLDEPSIVETAQQPPYVLLGLDIDAPHEVDIQLDRPPSAILGETLEFSFPPQLRTSAVYYEETPAELWRTLRTDSGTVALNDQDIWDLVAYVWHSQTTLESVQLGQRLYAENCAACHGENGDGAGVMATAQPAEIDSVPFGQALLPPSDFTDSQKMLGASSALLEGKIIRGGMGTGMPYWGSIFTDEQIEALIDYLWTFQFPMAVGG